MKSVANYIYYLCSFRYSKVPRFKLENVSVITSNGRDFFCKFSKTVFATQVNRKEYFCFFAHIFYCSLNSNLLLQIVCI